MGAGKQPACDPTPWVGPSSAADSLATATSGAAASACYASVGSIRLLDDVIDEMGWGLSQWSINLLSGVGGFVAAALKMMVAMVAVAVGRDMHLISTWRGAIVTAVLFGQAVGNIGFGAMADKVGRRPCLVACYAFMVIFTTCSVLADSLWSMLFWRICLGASFGLSTAPRNALSVETCPSQHRVRTTVCGGLLACFGYLYALILVYIQDPSMRNLSWRNLMLNTVLPAVPMFVAAYIWLPESPHFLSREARRPEAVAVLKWMRIQNGRGEVDVAQWTTIEKKSGGGIKDVFGPTLRCATLILCFNMFVLTYAHYGAIYALPQLLLTKDLQWPAVYLLMANVVVEIVGCFLSLCVDARLLRRGSLCAYAVVLSLSNFVFSAALAFIPKLEEHRLAGVAFAVLVIAMLTSNMAISVGSLFVKAYTTEVYPTSCRALGNGLTVGIGRAFSAICPLCVELFQESAVGMPGHFAIVGLGAAMCAGLAFCLPVETKDRQLSSIASEIQPCSTRDGKSWTSTTYNT